MGAVSESPPLFRRPFQTSPQKHPRGWRPCSHQHIHPITNDDDAVRPPSLTPNKKKPLSPRSSRSLSFSFPWRRRRTTQVRFTDVAIRVFDVTTYQNHQVEQAGGLTDTIFSPLVALVVAESESEASDLSSSLTLDWTYRDSESKVPVNLFEALHRTGPGIKSRTRVQLPRDFERLYRLSRCTSVPIAQ